jgi:hypothetical protein
MATVDKIRSQLIDKILTIKDKDFLEALDKLVASIVHHRTLWNSVQSKKRCSK